MERERKSEPIEQIAYFKPRQVSQVKNYSTKYLTPRADAIRKASREMRGIRGD